MDSNKTSCDIFNGDEQKCNAVLWTKRVIAIISVLACLVVISLIILLKKHKVFSHRLTLYLAVSCMLQSISQISNKNYTSGSLCTFLGWLLQFTDTTVLIWICAITFTILVLVIKQEQRTNTKEWLYHLICWGVSFVVSLLPFISSKYGPAGMWCWIVNDWKWRMGVYYIPAYTFTFILLLVYCFTQYKVLQLQKQWQGLNTSCVENLERKQKLLQDQVKPVFIYPGIYILIEIIPLTHRIYNAVHPSHTDPFGLVLLHSICLSLRGLLNGIVFLTINRGSLTGLKPSQLYIAFLNWRQNDDSLIQEYDLNSSSSVHTPCSHQPVPQASNTTRQQSMELDELDKHFYEVTKNMQAFGSELQFMNNKLEESKAN